MKNGWAEKKLSELYSFKNGINSTKHQKVGRGILTIDVLNMYGDDLYVDVDDLYRVDKEVKGEYILQEGDLLVVRSSVKRDGVGWATLFRPVDEPVTFCGFIIRARPVSNTLPEYLVHFLRCPSSRERLIGSAKQSTITNINQARLGELTVPVPPLPEQRRIVGILDEAFAGIATAKAHAEKNLQNARALFESHLNAVFTQRGDGDATHRATRVSKRSATSVSDEDSQTTKTGGRDATKNHIPPVRALAVGMPKTPPTKNWSWTPLTSLARMESGHTPSKRHPEYWNGDVPWIGIKDAKNHHGRRIHVTEQKTNDLGLANSSARLLPENTVCLSRTASVGYVVVMGRAMATSQDFVNWVCSDDLRPDFLKYLFLAETREGLQRYSSGAVHQTIYYPEAKAFHIAHPDTDEQERIVRQCDALRDKTQRLESIYQRKLAALDELKKSLLHQAFSGQL